MLPYDKVLNFLKSFDNFDFVVIGDVFWNTGQNICRAAKHLDITVFFMQHGQWIYVANKKSLEHYPDYTLLFGDDVEKECSSWEYGKCSKICSVGSPRYDEAVPYGHGSPYVYFSPPVIEEMIHKKPSGRIRTPFLRDLEKISGIDKYVSLIIHPHHRECRIDILRKLFPKAQFADPELDAIKLVRGSSKVLTSRNSTVVLDAIAHQKITILTDLPEFDVSFFPRGYFAEFAIESDSKTHLVANLIATKNPELSNYQHRAKRYIRLGDASTRIANLIMKEV